MPTMFLQAYFLIGLIMFITVFCYDTYECVKPIIINNELYYDNSSIIFDWKVTNQVNDETDTLKVNRNIKITKPKYGQQYFTKVIIPKNKVMKIYYKITFSNIKLKPIILTEGTYIDNIRDYRNLPSVFQYKYVALIWIGNKENINDIPDNIFY